MQGYYLSKPLSEHDLKVSLLPGRKTTRQRTLKSIETPDN